MNQTISITEKGKISVKPNLILINFTLISIDLDYATAIKNAENDVIILRQAIQNIGFDKNDLKTISFSINTKNENKQLPNGTWVNEFVGYECIHSLRLTFDYNLLILGVLLDEITKSKVNPEINIEFSLKDKEEIINLAIKKAIDNAKRKAELITNQLNVKIDTINNIQYNNENVGIQSFHLAKFMSEIVPEDLTVEEEITITWSIITK